MQETISKKKSNSFVLVVKPLISLMTDQIKLLEGKGVTVCRLMHSSSEGGNHHRGTKKITVQKLEQASIALTQPDPLYDFSCNHQNVLTSF